MNIYVGNLSPNTSEGQLRRAFERYGKVDKISMDKQSSKDINNRFSFVEMPFDKQASSAIRELHGKKLSEYVMIVRESGVSI